MDFILIGLLKTELCSKSPDTNSFKEVFTVKIRNGFVTNSSSSSFIAVMKGSLTKNQRFSYLIEDCSGDYENTRIELNDFEQSIGDANPGEFSSGMYELRGALSFYDNDMLITAILCKPKKDMIKSLMHPFDFMQLDIPNPESQEFETFCKDYADPGELEQTKRTLAALYQATKQNDNKFKVFFHEKKDLKTLYLAFTYGGRGEFLEDPLVFPMHFFSSEIREKVISPLTKDEEERLKQGESERTIRASRIKNSPEINLFDETSIESIVSFIIGFSNGDSEEVSMYYQNEALTIKQAWDQETGKCTFQFNFDDEC